MVPPWWDGILKYDRDQPSEADLENAYLLPVLERQGTRNPDKVSLCGLILAPESDRGEGYFRRLGVFDIDLLPFQTRDELMQHWSTQPNALLDESGYEKILGQDEDGRKQYAITLV